MAKREKRPARTQRMEALWEQGNHRLAAAEARMIAADADSSAADKEAASVVLARAKPEPRAVLIAGVTFALLLFVVAFGILGK